MKIYEDSDNLLDVLYEFGVAQDFPDANLLERFIRRFPQYTAELRAFAVDLTLESLSEGLAGVEVDTVRDGSPTVSRAVSRFHNCLHAAGSGPSSKDTEEVTTAPENPFLPLSKDELRGLAKRLNANTVLVMKLRDRQISLNTIPQRFLELLVRELGATVDAVRSHLSAPATMQLGLAHYKASGKPHASTKQGFEEAVRNSGLATEQQDALLRNSDETV